MRILHIITSLRTGGAERLIVDILPVLHDAGEDVSLLLMDGTRTPLFNELERDGITIKFLSIGRMAMHNPLLVFPLIRILRKERFDIIHTHNTPCQLIAAVASIFVPSILVTTEHSTTNKRRLWKALKIADSWMYRRYRTIICVEKATQRTLLDYLPGLSQKTVVISNGINLDKFYLATPSNVITAVTGFKILMVAAFRAPKDQACLIRAANLLPEDYHLFLAGGAETQDDEERLQSCQSLVRNLNLENKVSFLGIRDDVPDLLAACDVAVLSSHYEGFGLSAVEAMASGKVLIASDVESLTTLVGGAGLLFPPGDAEKLAGLIRQVCENPDQAHEIGERCRKRAAQYDIAETARRYKEEYYRILVCPN